MTTYLFESIPESVFGLMLKSSLVLLVLLGLYRWLLENQPMHRLKRVYLLGTLLLSLVAVAVRPLITIEVPLEASTASAASPEASTPGTLSLAGVLSGAGIGQEVASEQQWPQRPTSATVGNAAVRHLPEPGGYWLWLYGLGTLLMLARFFRNLYVLAWQVTVNPTQPFRGATLVRLPDNGLPYTFLHYLFVPDAAYQRGEIEGELFVHELAHIRQRHSLDVLLVELVLCFGWFNPLLFWLKRVIQRNHEFLADEAVNTQYGNVSGYQHLLLSKLTIAPRLSLTSTLTFQTTKQRLLMMTKRASATRTWLVGTSSVLILGTLTFMLAAQMVTQQTLAKPALPADGQLTVEEMERRFRHKRVIIFPELREELGVKETLFFFELTPEQKQRVVYRPHDPRKTPIEAEWRDFQNTKKYGVWVDGKRRRDTPVSRQLKRTDVIYFHYSHVAAIARRPRSYLYQLELFTEDGYQKLLREYEEHPMLFLLQPIQQTPASPKAEVTAPAKPTQQLDVAGMERQFGDKMVNGIKRGEGNFTGQKKFRDLTPDEKKRVLVLRPNPRKTPTESEWKAFHNPKKYGIRVDEKRRRDNPLARYKRTDIVYFWYSFVHKNARQPEGYTNQLELYTEAGYQETLREWQEKPWLQLMTTEQFERQQKARAAK